MLLERGGVSTAGVILTIGAMAGAVMLPEAVIPVALGAGILGTSMAVGGSYVYFRRSTYDSVSILIGDINESEIYMNKERIIRMIMKCKL
jgi:hypothetical protein